MAADHDAPVFPGDYSELSRVAEGLLDFSVPTGVALGAVKRISPYFLRHLSIGLVDVPRFVGFNYVSHPRQSNAAVNPFAGASADLAAAHEPAAAGQDEDYSQPLPVQGWRLFSCVFDDGSVEAMLDHRPSARWRFQASGISSFHKNMSHLNFLAFRYAPNWSGRMIYTTEEHMLGFSGMRALSSSKEWAVGGEVFYSFSQEAPGLSVGARYHTVNANTGHTTVVATTFSPIPGHVTATYTSDLTQAMVASTRFEYNVHSNEAEFGVGLRLQPPNSPFDLRFRVDTSHGIGVLLRARFPHLTLALGAGCSFPPNVTTRVGLDLRVESSRDGGYAG
ncbi:hypothetical protein CAOG_09076 [Capsaspora owczarzaki ATCC 30864]|uniref:Mitochondrial import receptor subunit TOM40 n=1 Tax=Capsaspora owczarzaki (strain ATCC 30864) TaxID=595528 RepID=A0A0D2VZX9_CAPO3|nr:hypothetical protein CAOG_09076 [Capsaspora owczarzaki ATCC 30864]KJE97447.1 hypothetical protein CAOG_009076 [Capsaspora owczarzaki ATCC 30864]|eukprot:XP_011270809.1 hypothetical protein CAOG_09076 [Capsaspora owczarzaki ATCC 30864]